MVTAAALVRALFVALSLAAAEPVQTPAPLSATAAAPAALSATPQALSPAAQTKDLPLLPERPKPPQLTTPPRWEYITVVTLLSAPFTALWYGLLFGAVESVVQRRLPPKVSSSAYAGLAAAAGGTSLGIALFSVSWGSQGRPLSPGAAVSLQNVPTPSPGTRPHA